MGMPCEVNTILKLTPDQGYPPQLEVSSHHSAHKTGYRLFPLDVLLSLVDENWLAHADVVIEKLTWANQMTQLEFKVTRCYDAPFHTR